MKAIINIGLARKGLPDLPIGEVLRTLKEAKIDVEFWLTRSSDTEETLVATVSGPVLSASYIVAQRLDQDCIAVYDPRSDIGRLIGPNAAAWGSFNPEFFLLLDGSILSRTVATA